MHNETSVVAAPSAKQRTQGIPQHKDTLDTDAVKEENRKGRRVTIKHAPSTEKVMIGGPKMGQRHRRAERAATTEQAMSRVRKIETAPVDSDVPTTEEQGILRARQQPIHALGPPTVIRRPTRISIGRKTLEPRLSESTSQSAQKSTKPVKGDNCAMR